MSVSVVKKLLNRGLLSPVPPHFVTDSTQYEVIVGSLAYGTSNDSSDFDVMGFTIPPRDQVYLNLQGYIPGYDMPHKLPFEQYQKAHILILRLEREKGENTISQSTTSKSSSGFVRTIIPI